MHLKSLSESLQTAHDVFTHPEDDVKVSWSIELKYMKVFVLRAENMFRECHSQL